RFVWTDDWRVRLGTWVVVSVGLIGIAWPLLLMLLIRLGLAPGRPAKARAYNLDRFKFENPPAAPASREVDAKELEKLRVLEAELERNLRAAMSQSPPSATASPNSIADQDSSPPSVNSLRPDERFSATQGEPLVATAKPDEEKSYGGTF